MKYIEDVIKCAFWHMKGGVILQYSIRLDGGTTIPQTKNDTFISKNPILTLQGHNTTNKYLETKNWDF